MIRLTNMSNPNVLDMPIYINTEHIASVYERRNEASVATIVYCVNGTEWVVEESLTEVMRKINESR